MSSKDPCFPPHTVVFMAETILAIGSVMIFMYSVVGCPIILLRGFSAMIPRTVYQMVEPGEEEKLISSLLCRIKLAPNYEHSCIH